MEIQSGNCSKSLDLCHKNPFLDFTLHCVPAVTGNSHFQHCFSLLFITSQPIFLSEPFSSSFHFPVTVPFSRHCSIFPSLLHFPVTALSSSWQSIFSTKLVAVAGNRTRATIVQQIPSALPSELSELLKRCWHTWSINYPTLLKQDQNIFFHIFISFKLFIFSR